MRGILRVDRDETIAASDTLLFGAHDGGDASLLLREVVHSGLRSQSPAIEPPPDGARPGGARTLRESSEGRQRQAVSVNVRVFAGAACSCLAKPQDPEVLFAEHCEVEVG